MDSNSVQSFQNFSNSIIGIVFFGDLLNDREALENSAVQAVCACRYYDLVDTLQESPVEDLLAIVAKALPCEICGD